MRIFVYTFLFLLTGCNSHIPSLIKSLPEQDISYKQVKNNTMDYQDQYVRWGGKIVSIENKENSTWIEILATPLNNFGRPSSSDDYQGRFIARIDGFLEPEKYSKDRFLTIYGNIESNVIKRLDEYPYNYPLIYAEEYHLWDNLQSTQYYVPYNYGYYPHHFHPYFPYPYYRFQFDRINPYW